MLIITDGDIGEEQEIIHFEPLPQEIPAEPVLVPAEPELVPA